jgi:hypothetical protein
VFDNINKAQWIWYSEMFQQDIKETSRYEIEMVEYMASFWNSEAVQKIKKARADKEVHNFASDKEFEEQIKSESYKNNPYLDAVKRINQARTTANKEDEREAYPKIKMPTDLDYLAELGLKNRK